MAALVETKDAEGNVLCYVCPVCQQNFQLAERVIGESHVEEHSKQLVEG